LPASGHHGRIPFQADVVFQSALYLNGRILNKPALPQRNIGRHFAP